MSGSRLTTSGPMSQSAGSAPLRQRGSSTSRSGGHSVSPLLARAAFAANNGPPWKSGRRSAPTGPGDFSALDTRRPSSALGLCSSAFFLLSLGFRAPVNVSLPRLIGRCVRYVGGVFFRTGLRREVILVFLFWCGNHVLLLTFSESRAWRERRGGCSRHRSFQRDGVWHVAAPRSTTVSSPVCGEWRGEWWIGMGGAAPAVPFNPRNKEGQWRWISYARTGLFRLILSTRLEQRVDFIYNLIAASQYLQLILSTNTY